MAEFVHEVPHGLVEGSDVVLYIHVPHGVALRGVDEAVERLEPGALRHPFLAFADRRRAATQKMYRQVIFIYSLVVLCYKGGSFSRPLDRRSEEHTSELQSLMRISYAVFCLKKKKIRIKNPLPN